MALAKRLLAISWAMPPLRFPRAQQVARTLKVLQERGWSCEVVTVQPKDVAAPLDGWLAQAYSAHYETIIVEVGERPTRTPLHRRILRRIGPAANGSDDIFFRRGIPIVLDRLRQHRHEVLATFGQPWIDHLVGLEIKRREPAVPWVAHFSDPWSDSPYVLPKADAGSELMQARRQERAVIESADSLVFVSEETADLVMRKYPPALRGKAHVVPHGYDTDVLKTVRPQVRPDNRLYLVHTGNLYGMRTPIELLHAIARLNETHDARRELVIDFIGEAPEECRQVTEQLGLFGQVHFLGRAGYRTCLEATASADALLLIDAPSEVNVFLPSKIVEYLMMGKPVLGLTPSVGASATTLRRCGFPVAAPDDRSAIHAALVQMLEEWRAGRLGTAVKPGDREVIGAFDIRSTTALFEKALYAACASACDRPQR